MRILALDAYHRGSHRDFLMRWIERSRHEFELLTLPGRHWKWRMRHAAIDLAERAGAVSASGRPFDAVFCTDMLNVAEFRGLAPSEVARAPTVVYFHENQLAYPRSDGGPAAERDEHFAFTNLTTALAADAAWFNSAFNRDSLLKGLAALVGRMPDHRPLAALDRIRAHAAVEAPPIEDAVLVDRERRCEPRAPLHILWAGRWEHDKRPDVFFRALELLREWGVAFRVSVLGGAGGEAPAAFVAARARLGEGVANWGYLPDRGAYRAVLLDADVFVSTAAHEFFGLAAVEAAASGAFPIVPGALAYPEVLGPLAPGESFHDGTAEDVARRLVRVSERHAATGVSWPSRDDRDRMRRGLEPLAISRRAPELDDAIERVRRDLFRPPHPTVTL